MTEFIKSVEVKGLHDRFDLSKATFREGVNILFGKNGTGKTTLLHILANVLNGDYRRFAYLVFHSLQVELGDGSRISLRRQDNREGVITVRINDSDVETFSSRDVIETRKRQVALDSPRSVRERMLVEMETDEATETSANSPLLGTAYFPAFRTMIEAWSAIGDERLAYLSPNRQATRWRTMATLRAREWFGDFVPQVNFPSLVEIQDQMGGQIEEAKTSVWRADRKLLTTAFLDIFRAISTESNRPHVSPEGILENIGELFDRLKATPLKAESMILTNIYDELRLYLGTLRFGQETEQTTTKVLEVYQKMLEGIATVQETSFSGIQHYLEAVNRFLEGKRLAVNTETPRRRGESIGLRFSDRPNLERLQALSSGERQIVTLIYAASRMSEQKVVLIDEPEISLHIDWQTKLLHEMTEQLGGRQIIACTHSPTIGEDYEDRLQRLGLQPMESTAFSQMALGFRSDRGEDE